MIDRLGIFLNTGIHHNEQYIIKTGKYQREQDCNKIRENAMYTGVLMMLYSKFLAAWSFFT
jgi:hypothetical protein